MNSRPFSGRSERATVLKSGMIHVIQAVTVLSCAVALLNVEGLARPAMLVGLVTALCTLSISLLYVSRAVAEFDSQQRMMDRAEEAKSQVEELFSMTDMLQAAEDHEDAGTVLMTTATRLLPDFSGALYVFNNSRDRLDLAKSWNQTEGFEPLASLGPQSCWALKRGKPHINDAERHTLRCMHKLGTASTVEVPMMARGQVYGLLVIGYEGENAFDRLKHVRRSARALADSMSLALSNIALREKLRTQSLRDPLTGLYNRRYMEDALERYINLAEQSGATISVIMIDLDNFKRLNDEHGHAKGDAVLRDVGGQLMAAVRPSDVVARYGGEELMVILPSCGLEDAALKAENLRARIESLSDVHGVSVTASLGVATVPETSSNAVDVIPMADAALYAAKLAGKNCIRLADRRAGNIKTPVEPSPEATTGPRLAASAT